MSTTARLTRHEVGAFVRLALYFLPVLLLLLAAVGHIMHTNAHIAKRTERAKAWVAAWHAQGCKPFVGEWRDPRDWALAPPTPAVFAIEEPVDADALLAATDGLSVRQFAKIVPAPGLAGTPLKLRGQIEVHVEKQGEGWKAWTKGRPTDGKAQGYLEIMRDFERPAPKHAPVIVVPVYCKGVTP